MTADEGTVPKGAGDDAFDEETAEPGSKAEWFLHPETVKQRKVLVELRVKQAKEMVRQGLSSPDPAMRGLASAIRILEAQILALGGHEMFWPDPADPRKGAVHR